MDLIKMNKTQLLETFEKHGIPVPEGKDADKGPTNKELIAAIEAHNGEVEPAPLPVREAAKAPVKVSTKMELFTADMTRKERVVVTDTQRFQSLDEEAPISFDVSFSNGIINEAKLVSLSGDPQLLPRCIINNLMGVDLEEWVQEGETTASIRKVKRKRFVVMPVEGMTDAEIETQKKRELARAGR